VLLDSIKKLPIPVIKGLKDIKYYPFLVSPCVNGVRVYVENGKVYGLNGKEIVNTYIKSVLAALGTSQGAYEGIINIAGKSSTGKVKEMVNSEVSEFEKDFIFHIHDFYNGSDLGYNQRLEILLLAVKNLQNNHIAYMPQKLIYTEPQLIKYEKAINTVGYDGIIIRKFDGKYPVNGSTLDEQIIVYKPLSI
jgi:hypothetical protein